MSNYLSNHCSIDHAPNQITAKIAKTLPMVELTIQISDELAQRLEPLQNRLPELLVQLLDAANLATNSQPIVKTETIDITRSLSRSL